MVQVGVVFFIIRLSFPPHTSRLSLYFPYPMPCYTWKPMKIRTSFSSRKRRRSSSCYCCFRECHPLWWRRGSNASCLTHADAVVTASAWECMSTAEVAFQTLKHDPWWTKALSVQRPLSCTMQRPLSCLRSALAATHIAWTIVAGGTRTHTRDDTILRSYKMER